MSYDRLIDTYIVSDKLSRVKLNDNRNITYRDLKTGKKITVEQINAAAKWVNTKNKIKKVTKNIVNSGKNFVKNLFK